MAPSPSLTAFAPTAPPRPNFVSPRRMEANRRNARLSTGPRTEKGKQRSRLNGRCHDITGQIHLLPDPERAAADAFCAGIVNSFTPVGAHESTLAQLIAVAYWRMNRAHAVEDSLFGIRVATHPDSDIAGGDTQGATGIHMATAFSEQSATFGLLSLYEQRIQCSLDRNRQTLRELQKERTEAEAKALEESKLLRQYAQQHGEEFDAEGEAKENGGFSFSTDRLDALNLRDYRLRIARATVNSWKPVPAPMQITATAARALQAA